MAWEWAVHGAEPEAVLLVRALAGLEVHLVPALRADLHAGLAPDLRGGLPAALARLADPVVLEARQGRDLPLPLPLARPMK